MINFIEQLKENKFLLGIFIAIIVIIFTTEFLVVYYLKYEINNNKIEETDINLNSNILVEETYEEKKVFVEIKGEVIKPGTYEVQADKRIIDVIKLAEGLTKNADTSVINLSKKVEDEMVIMIYSKEQIKSFLQVKKEEQILIEQCNKDSLTNNNACVESDTSLTGLISINKATKEELMTLPGIGEEKALNIIDYREKVSLFSTIEDLKKVTGIGDSIYDKIKNLITP